MLRTIFKKIAKRSYSRHNISTNTLLTTCSRLFTPTRNRRGCQTDTSKKQYSFPCKKKKKHDHTLRLPPIDAQSINPVPKALPPTFVLLLRCKWSNIQLMKRIKLSASRARARNALLHGNRRFFLDSTGWPSFEHLLYLKARRLTGADVLQLAPVLSILRPVASVKRNNYWLLAQDERDANHHFWVGLTYIHDPIYCTPTLE